MPVTLLKDFLVSQLRIIGPGIEYCSGKHCIEVDELVRLGDDPAVDGTRPGLVGRAVVLHGLAHEPDLLLGEPLTQDRIGLQHPSGYQMVELAALTDTDIVIGRYGKYHVRIQRCPVRTVLFFLHKSPVKFHALADDREYMTARMGLVISIIPRQHALTHICLQRGADLRIMPEFNCCHAF